MDKSSPCQRQAAWTPSALFKKYKSSSPGHLHDFRLCQAFPLDRKKENDFVDNNVGRTSFTSASAPTSTKAQLWTSRFLCHTCHTWLCITSTSLQHTCTGEGFATHHYHSIITKSQLSTASTQQYQCCGCQDQVELVFMDSVVPAKFLLDISDSPSGETTTQTTTEILVSCHAYLKNMPGNINTQNGHFTERARLNDTTKQLLELIGFTYQNGYFMAPKEVDNNKLYMVCEELAAWILEHTPFTTTKGERTLQTNKYPLANLIILDTLLGCRQSVEYGDRKKQIGLDVVVDAYDLLGITSSATDDLIVWAYRQLVNEQHDMINPPTLQDALKAITMVKGGRILENELATANNKGCTSKQTDVDNAYRYFGVQKDIDDETILIAHQYKVQDSPRQKKTHDAKLKIIGESRQSVAILQSLTDGIGSVEQESSNRKRQKVSSPVGLKNIGNTCYLNSLLQYYYTIIPLKTTIINKDNHVKTVNKADWKSKEVVGSIQSDRKTMKKAKKFTDLLQSLFIQLAYTPDNEIEPTLALANMALLAEDDDDDDDDNSLVEEYAIIQSEGTNEFDDDNSAATQSHSFDTNMDTHDEHQPSNDSKKETDQQFKVTSTAAANDTMTLGKQQDMIECMGNMMYLLEAALAPQKMENRMELTGNLIHHLFFGKMCQRLSCKGDTTRNFSKVMEENFSHVIVDASERKTLYDGLDEYFFANKVENYQGGQEAIREVTIVNSPPILQIQVQRVQFDKTTHSTYKSNAFVSFDKTIYLDRYLDSNFQRLATRRAKVDNWAQQRQQCLQKIKNLSVEMKSTMPGESIDVPMSWILEKSASLLGGFELGHPEYDATEVDNAVSHLMQEAANGENSFKDYIDQVDDYETKIRHEYDDLTDCAYQLYAVFMHKGEANYGHYWVYILDYRTNCWWKFNDSLVTKVEHYEVFKDTTGTNTNCNFLVYVKQDDIDSLTEMSFTSTRHNSVLNKRPYVK
ncbi:hypothetical protein BC941DRAFT_510834 [Chlamydoabsidia padenii]|nr:hypothetical protein BC941DRAFT_510834 [Chlamydoabsidia padenii]